MSGQSTGLRLFSPCPPRGDLLVKPWDTLPHANTRVAGVFALPWRYPQPRVSRWSEREGREAEAAWPLFPTLFLCRVVTQIG